MDTATSSFVNRSDIVERLTRDHDSIRMWLRLAPDETPLIAAAAKRLSDLCLLHFEFEEAHVFPVLEKTEWFPDGGASNVEEQCCDQRYGRDHGAIICVAHVLLAVARRQGRQELAELAELIAQHESSEDDLRAAAFGSSISPQ